MGANNSSSSSQQLATDLCNVAKELSKEESLMILRYWREIAVTKKKDDKVLEKHIQRKTKPKLKTSKGIQIQQKKQIPVSLSSEITKKEFIQLFEDISQTEQFADHYPILTKQTAIEYLFQAFDVLNTGKISLESFISGLSVLSSGSLSQKAEMIFRACDLNNDGVVTREELSKSLRKGIRGAISVLKKEAPDLTPEELCKITGKMDELSVQRTVDHIFEICNANKGIALDEWILQSEKDDALQHLLKAMTVSGDIIINKEERDFAHVFPIHPKLLDKTDNIV